LSVHEIQKLKEILDLIEFAFCMYSRGVERGRLFRSAALFGSLLSIERGPDRAPLCSLSCREFVRLGVRSSTAIRVFLSKVERYCGRRQTRPEKMRLPAGHAGARDAVGAGAGESAFCRLRATSICIASLCLPQCSFL